MGHLKLMANDGTLCCVYTVPKTSLNKVNLSHRGEIESYSRFLPLGAEAWNAIESIIVLFCIVAHLKDRYLTIPGTRSDVKS